ncbi:MFS transporter [Corynebacterium resistens]|uniref:MFS transporter n=1 Tax=Corynebacterium resistens TaxID=258224 RepID=UPI0001E28434|nr:MFS transporter [Corynebacterium resistens]
MTRDDLAQTKPADSPPPNREGLTPTDPRYRRALIAALCAGLASFNALYATQAVLPALSDDFAVSPTIAALTVSATTGALALTVLPAGVISERFGRRQVIQISALVATVLSLLLCFMPSIQSIIALRFVQGIAVAGVPAVVMTYLAEEIHGRHLPRVMGFYISGTTLGGLLGRLIPGIALDFTSWRYAVLLSAGFAVLMAVITATVIPPQHHFRPKSITWGHELTAIGQHLRNPVLLRLFALPFLLMGTFVSLYNYLGFRLIEDFGLPASLAAMTFLMYLSGTWSSARAGSLVSTWGRSRVVAGSCLIGAVGLTLLFIPTLPSTLIGCLAFTAAFFAAHSAASAWVGEIATHDRAEASSLYVFSYYIGSSLMGWISGYFFHAGWPVFVAWIATIVSISFVIALSLFKRGRTRHQKN